MRQATAAVLLMALLLEVLHGHPQPHVEARRVHLVHRAPTALRTVVHVAM